MKKVICFLFSIFISFNSFAEVRVGEVAPAISIAGINGSKMDLQNYLGKIIILEWKNHDCPFVRKHYETGNMQMLQKYVTENGGLWFSIISSAKGKQGYVTADQAQEIADNQGSYAIDIVLDTKTFEK